MPSSYTDRNRLEKQATGENLSTWGDRLNDNVIGLVDEALDGVTTISTSGSHTLTSNNAATDQARKRVIDITAASGTTTITIPNVEKLYFVRNGSTGASTITTGSGTSATVGGGVNKWVYCDGNNVVYQESIEDFGDLDITTTGDASFGTVTTTGTATFGGVANVAATLRATGNAAPSSGAGMEIYYVSGSNQGVIQAYDRTGAAYKGILLQGSSIDFYLSGAQRLALNSSGIYLSTLASSSGTTLVQDGSGYLKKSTSSRRYKKDIEPLTDELADRVLALPTITYAAKEGDEGRRFLGFIAEDAHEAGLDCLVHYNSEGEPESFAYERVVVALVNKINRLQARLDALEAR
jgi:hypothetical protein